jgi:tRNA (mo5U34)-methyltransferase
MSISSQAMTKDHLEQAVRSIPTWFHSLDLGHGVVTPGAKTSEHLGRELESLCLPDLRGKSVLDIGAWDGFYSWTAERLGARRVVSLDHFVWSLDMRRGDELRRRWHDEGLAPKRWEETDAWRPRDLPGKRGYDLAHRVFRSRAETVVEDFLEVDFKKLGGPFDVVLWLGVLYHMRDPLFALEKVAEATKEVAVIETEAIKVSPSPENALCQFFERDELVGDPTNWWAPNEKALVGLCRAAGFDRVEVIQGEPVDSPSRPKRSLWNRLRSAGGHVLREFGLKPPRPLPKPEIFRYRAVVHAWK